MTLATLVRQVVRDVWHDLGWIVLYGALMSCAAYALVLTAVNARWWQTREPPRSSFSSAAPRR